MFEEANNAFRLGKSQCHQSKKLFFCNNSEEQNMDGQQNGDEERGICWLASSTQHFQFDTHNTALCQDENAIVRTEIRTNMNEQGKGRYEGPPKDVQRRCQLVRVPYPR